MCSSYPSLDGGSIPHLTCFDNSTDEKQRGSSKKQDDSSDRQTQKKEAGKKRPRKAQVEP